MISFFKWRGLPVNSPKGPQNPKYPENLKETNSRATKDWDERDRDDHDIKTIEGRTTKRAWKLNEIISMIVQLYIQCSNVHQIRFLLKK